MKQWSFFLIALVAIFAIIIFGNILLDPCYGFPVFDFPVWYPEVNGWCVPHEILGLKFLEWETFN